MTREEWEAFRRMKLSEEGSVATAEQWAIRLNVPVDEIRDGYRPHWHQGELVLRRVP